MQEYFFSIDQNSLIEFRIVPNSADLVLSLNYWLYDRSVKEIKTKVV